MARKKKVTTSVPVDSESVVAFMPNHPAISFDHDYVWIGNDADDDGNCFGTISKLRDLRKLAAGIDKIIKQRTR